ncbi:MAG TPA: hypothetical protein VF941_13220, partial [Clostridia bacterium]
GMESGCERILKSLKNSTKATVQNNRRAIELANRYAIPLLGSFMIGNPTETEDELLMTLDFIKSYRYSPFLAPLSYIATAFPGTEFWDYAELNNLSVQDFDNILMDIPDDINRMTKAPLLTDIPIKKFFYIAHEFKKETLYERVKRHLYSRPFYPINLLKAFYNGVLIEKSLVKGLVEVTRILLSFIRLERHVKLH